MANAESREGGLSFSAVGASSGLLVLLTVFGLFSVGSRGTREPTAAARDSKLETAGGASAGMTGSLELAPAMSLLYGYFGGRPSSDPKSAATTPPVSREPAVTSVENAAAPAADNSAWNRQVRELNDCLSHDANIRLDCLVAIVPDPVDSHFQHSFDQAVASIVQGLERHEFVLDRYRLPWSDDLGRLAGRGSGGGDHTARDQPGVLLFRRIKSELKSGDAAESLRHDLCLVLLVGEAPTFGVQTAACTAALDFAAAVAVRNDRSETSQGEELRTTRAALQILGPTYSGTSPSLRRTLERWWRERAAREPELHCDVQIVSGSATADQNRSLLTMRESLATGAPQTGQEGAAGAASSAPRATLSTDFRATVLPDSVLVNSVLAHLRATSGLAPGQIAILSESSTSYGAEGTSGAQAGGSTVVLPFPMSLSRVRSEADRLAAPVADRRGDGTSWRNLNISLDFDPYAIDSLPQYSRVSAAATDVILEQILATIARDDIRAVGIIGTDVRDKLFLAKTVRAHAPDVQIVLVESDVLYAHAQYSTILRGAVIASSYPLFPRSQAWTAPRSSHEPSLQFPTDANQGVYNATIGLLNDSRRFGGANSKSVRPLVDYAFPFASASDALRQGPSAWLSIVGDRSLWPVACRSATAGQAVRDYVYANEHRAAADLDVLQPQAFPPGSVVGPAFHTAIGLLAIGIALANLPICRAWRPTHELSAWLRNTLAWLTIDPDDRAWRRRPRVDRREAIGVAGRNAALVYGLIVMLFVGVAVTSAPQIAHWLRFRELPGAVTASTRVGLLLTGFATAGLTFAAGVIGLLIGVYVHASGVAWHDRTQRVTLGSPNLWVFILAPAAIPLVAWWFVLRAIERLPQVDAAIFVERAGTASGGVSPLIPLAILILALAAWLVVNLRRGWYSRLFLIDDPFGDDQLHPADGARRAVTGGFTVRLEELRRRLSGSWIWLSEPSSVYVAPTFVLAFGYLAWRWIFTAEGLWFDGMLAVLAVAAAVGAASQLARVQGVFRTLTRFTRRLGQHPLAPAFYRVPAALAAKASAQLFAPPPQPGDLGPAVRTARWLLDHADEASVEVPDEAREAVDRIERVFARYLRRDPSRRREILRDGAELHAANATLCRRMLTPELLGTWSTRRSIDGNPVEAEKGGEPLSPRAAWEAEAEKFLAMHVVELLRYTFAHLQNLLTCLFTILLAALWCVNSYPFQPNNLILSMCFGAIVWATLMVLWGLVKFNQDAVLSRLSGTTPNRLTFDRSLVLPVMTYVVVPFTGLLASRFPFVSSGLFHWIDALQQILRT